MNALTFAELIEKYNPYHDSSGRFSTADGAASFSIAGTQAQRDKAKDKEAARTAAMAASGKLPVDEPNERTFRRYEGDVFEIREALDIEREKQWGTVKPTSEEESAISAYTGKNFQIINGYLRGTEKEPDKAILNDVDRLKDLTSRAVLNEDTVLMRGMRTDTFSAVFGTKDTAALKKKLVGKTIEDKAFVSTTVDRETIASFGDVYFMINAKAGAKALIVDGKSRHPNEGEVILPPGAKMKVTAVKTEWKKTLGASRPAQKHIVIEAEYE